MGYNKKLINLEQFKRSMNQWSTNKQIRRIHIPQSSGFYSLLGAFPTPMQKKYWIFIKFGMNIYVYAYQVSLNWSKPVVRYRNGWTDEQCHFNLIHHEQFKGSVRLWMHAKLTFTPATYLIKPHGSVNILRNASTILRGRNVKMNRKASTHWKNPYVQNWNKNKGEIPTCTCM